MSAKCIRPRLYIVGDLAYYGMILGKEGMSGKWCHLCKLSAAEMADLMKDGKSWAYDEMKKLAEKYKKKLEEKKKHPTKTMLKPTKGMKDQPWFDFIPLDHFVVPLLHCLIGIGNDLFKRFRDTIREHIEYLSKEEARTWSHGQQDR